MRRSPAVLTPFLLILAGCLSPPIPEELLNVDRPRAADPMDAQDMARLSRAGISEEVMLELLQTRGVADRPPAAEARTPKRTIVFRELFVPLWPFYGGGCWHFGCRMGIFYRTVLEEPPRPPAPEPGSPQP
jgi:hypothetical protein